MFKSKHIHIAFEVVERLRLEGIELETPPLVFSYFDIEPKGKDQLLWTPYWSIMFSKDGSITGSWGKPPKCIKGLNRKAAHFDLKIERV